MNESLHIQLLKQFKETGKPVDIAGFITQKFAVLGQFNRINKNTIVLFLEDLEKRHHVRPLHGYDGVWFFETIDNFVQPIWRCPETNDKLLYSITVNGMDYLDLYDTKKSAKLAVVRSWIAIGIAVLSVILTGWALLNKHN